MNAALVAGLAPEMIPKDGLIATMGEVSRLFKENGVFVPEMLVAVRTPRGQEAELGT